MTQRKFFDKIGYMNDIPIKKCLVCGKEFAKPYYCGMPEWKNKRKLCSHGCSKIWLKGKHLSTRTEFKKGQKAINPIRRGEHHSIKTEFKKGFTPWNTGRPWTDKERKKISDSLPRRFGKDSGKM